MVRGKACVSVSGIGTVEGIEPFKPALLRALPVPEVFTGTI